VFLIPLPFIKFLSRFTNYKIVYCEKRDRGINETINWRKGRDKRDRGINETINWRKRRDKRDRGINETINWRKRRDKRDRGMNETINWRKRRKLKILKFLFSARAASTLAWRNGKMIFFFCMTADFDRFSKRWLNE